jgi:signal transduction histidine kinase
MVDGSMARIVHIEDDPANRLLVRKLLGRAGHEVLDAPDGITGIQLARESRPDLVLVDIAIPGLDGFEVTLRLRGEQRLRGVPIVAITAQGDRDTSLAVGCDGFLQKPIDAKTFARTIAGFLGGAREAPAAATEDPLRLQSQRIVAHLEQKVAELSAANERLRELDAARSMFYRNVTHELATPLTPIVGYVRLLLDGELGPVTAAQQRALGSMQQCVDRLGSTIQNLLDVTALETGRMRFASVPYDVADLVREVCAERRSRVEGARHRLVTALGKDDYRAVGDPPRLTRAVAELISNAVEFMPEPGAIGVRLRAVEGDRVEICVADTGPGIPADRIGRVFEAFYQVDGSVTREHGGVGVGLAIARRTAQGLGGDLRVESPARETWGETTFDGAAFYLTVSRKPPPAASGGDRVAETPTPSGSGDERGTG